MTLLRLEHVRCARGTGHGRHIILGDASFQLDAGELAMVWGLRGSGRSTLLRIAAGIEHPDSGRVRFEELDLSLHAEKLLGSQIGFCQPTFAYSEGHTALEHTMVGLLARWTRPSLARTLAHAALERVAASHCADMRYSELSTSESVRVAIARALTLEPRLLVIDEPVRGVELSERDPILALLRALADDGIAVLASAGEATSLSEVDLALTIGNGELHCVHAPLASVIGLPTKARAADSWQGC